MFILSLTESDIFSAFLVAFVWSLTSNHFPITVMGSNPVRDLGIMLESYPASLWKVGDSTQELACA
jgi:hypothetical protein